MDTAAAERALRENALTVKGKGGKVRIVPIEDDRITMMLQRLLEKTERGKSAFSSVSVILVILLFCCIVLPRAQSGPAGACPPSINAGTPHRNSRLQSRIPTAFFRFCRQ